jgi:hypothetical protein
MVQNVFVLFSIVAILSSVHEHTQIISQFIISKTSSFYVVEKLLILDRGILK